MSGIVAQTSALWRLTRGLIGLLAGGVIAPIRFSRGLWR